MPRLNIDTLQGLTMAQLIEELLEWGLELDKVERLAPVLHPILERAHAGDARQLELLKQQLLVGAGRALLH